MDFITSPINFTDLKCNLEKCDELFLTHQICLMHKEIENAFTHFEQLVNFRLSHLAIMEDLLLPTYEKLFNEPPAGAKSLFFIREKRLIQKHLDKHIRKLAEIALHSQRLSIVTLFEEYAWLKDLLDHHDAREKAFLFPGLDKRMTETDKRSLFSAIHSRLIRVGEGSQ